MRGVNAKCRWEKNKIGCCCKRPFATQVSVANRLKRCYLRRIPFALMLVVMMTRMSRMSMAVMMMSMHFRPDCTTKRLERYQVSRKPLPFKMRRRGSSPPKVTIWHLLKLRFGPRWWATERTNPKTSHMHCKEVNIHNIWCSDLQNLRSEDNDKQIEKKAIIATNTIPDVLVRKTWGQTMNR